MSDCISSAKRALSLLLVLSSGLCFIYNLLPYSEGSLLSYVQDTISGSRGQRYVDGSIAIFFVNKKGCHHCYPHSTFNVLTRFADHLQFASFLFLLSASLLFLSPPSISSIFFLSLLFLCVCVSYFLVCFVVQAYYYYRHGGGQRQPCHRDATLLFERNGTHTGHKNNIKKKASK